MVLIPVLLQAYRSQSKIISVLMERKLPVHQRFLRILCLSIMQKSLIVWKKPDWSLSEKQTWMNLPWEVQQRPPLTASPETHGIWNMYRGGSSGGSCAAVAAGETYLALGSDTGGSIRQPSSYCGVTGIKPTYGTVSRYGLVAYASSLDQIGPVGKDVSDCAALLEIIAGHDTKDSTSMKREDLQFSKELTGDIKGMKFGVPEEYLAEGLDPEVKASFMGVLDTLKELGAEVEFFSIKTMEYMIPAYYIIASAEASSNLERFDGVKYGFRAAEYEGLHDMYKKTRTAGFGEEVKRRIMLGSFVLSSGYYDAYYLKALRTKSPDQERI